MNRVVHVIGNGDSAGLYTREKRHGVKIACNQTPFPIPDKYATVIVDYKFMDVLGSGEVVIDGQWICGFRPKKWFEINPKHHMRMAKQVKEFYTILPKYAITNNKIGEGYTNFNCGHVAVHYACNKLKATEVHMYGFDSIFDFNLRSFSDLILTSDRGNNLSNKLATIWRPIWTNIWKEFPNVQFILHYNHDKFKVAHGSNVTAKIYKKETIDPKVFSMTPDGNPVINIPS